LRHLRALGFDGVVDGGANVGEFAFLARLALPEADIVCVEPQPDCARVLRRRGFRVVEKALWNIQTDLTLSQVGPSRTSCTVANSPDPIQSWAVPTIRLDQLAVQGSRLLVKLDLQGCEMTALAGMGSLWSRCSGLLLEVSFGPNGTYSPIAALLADSGYREYSTVNELFVDGRVVEADKLWLLSKRHDELLAPTAGR
jgi:FkbM family methyltransferase